MIYLNGKEVKFIEFPNKERRLDLPEDMVNTDLYEIVNDVYWKYEDDASIFELLLLDSTIETYGEQYNLYIGYMPYSRMDRIENTGTAFALDMMTDILTRNLSSLNLIVILDPHSDVTLNQLNKKAKRIDEAFDYDLAYEFTYRTIGYKKYEFAKDVINYTRLDINNAWFVFPDKGAAKRYNANDYPNVIICEKVRDFATGKIKEIKAHIEKQTTKPEQDAPIVIIDDLCSYGGTFVGAIKAIESDLNIKSENNWLIVTHAEKAMMLADIPNTFSKVFSTDSIATPPGAICMSEPEFDEKHQFYVKPVLDIIEELK
jgi:hypothetical protein